MVPWLKLGVRQLLSRQLSRNPGYRRRVEQLHLKCHGRNSFWTKEYMDWKELKPDFDFQTPPGYEWMLERGLINFRESPLYPWYFLDRVESFDPNREWKKADSNSKMVAFARRHDNDDIACFRIKEGRIDVALIHGWTESGYDLLATYDNYWDWVK